MISGGFDIARATMLLAPGPTYSNSEAQERIQQKQEEREIIMESNVIFFPELYNTRSSPSTHVRDRGLK
jgi:hypothetical protein